MKRFLSLLAACCLTLTGAAQISYDELAEQVAQMNAQAPISMGHSLTIVSVSLTPREMEYFVRMNTMGKIPHLDEKMMTDYAKSLLAGREDILALTQSLEALDICFTYHYIYNSDADTTTVTLTPADLEYIRTHELSAEEKLDLFLASQKVGLPMQAGGGVTMVDLVKEDGCVAWVAEVDETLIDMAAVEKNLPATRSVLTSALARDAVSLEQIRIFVNCHMGLRYTYRGSVTGKTCTLTFSEAELREMLQ